jgi:hypothetical protein
LLGQIERMQKEVAETQSTLPPEDRVLHEETNKTILNELAGSKDGDEPSASSSQNALAKTSGDS